MKENSILDKLYEIHAKHRIKKGNVSEHTKTAQIITKEWQDAFVIDKKQNCNQMNGLCMEVRVSEKNNEKIDLVDKLNGVAYELKVSGKNCHHEFYKDLMKVLTYNLNNPENTLNKLIFISEEEGISMLNNRLDPKLIELMNETHGINIVLKSIPLYVS